MVRGGAPTSNPQVKGGGYWRLRGGVSAQCAGSPRSISSLVTIIIILQIVREDEDVPGGRCKMATAFRKQFEIS